MRDQASIVHGLGVVMPNDVEALPGCRGFKISGDRIEFGIRRPRSTGRKIPAAISELTFAYIIGYIDKVELMRCIGLLKQGPEPGSLTLRVAGKIEYDRHAFGE